MLLEFRRSWPWVRRHECVPLSINSPAIRYGGTSGVHRSWVRTSAGLGWLHHHAEGHYVIELTNGALIQRRGGDFEHVEAP